MSSEDDACKQRRCWLPLTELVVVAIHRNFQVYVAEQENTVTENLLTIKQVAARLALGRTTVYELIAKQELKTIRIGRARRVPESVLEQWIAQQLHDPEVESRLVERIPKIR